MADVNIPLPFEAYRGNKPYVFVSYAHADGAMVFPELKHLHDQGYRLWYDEGIDPGNEWPDEVAQALEASALFLVFISSRSVKSKNVCDEIHFALNISKPLIACHLEETVMPPGLLLRMGSVQAIFKYRMEYATFRRKINRVLPSTVLSRDIADLHDESEVQMEVATQSKTQRRLPGRTGETSVMPGRIVEQGDSPMDDEVSMGFMEFDSPVVDFDLLPGADGLVVCGIDEAYIVKSLKDGPPKTFTFTESEGMCCAVSPDGALVAIGTCFASVEVYSIATGELVRVLRRDQTDAEKRRFDEIGARDESFDYGIVRFSPCGNFVAAGRRLSERDVERIHYPHSIDQLDEPVDIFHLSGEFLYCLPGYGCRPTIAFSADGKHLMLGLESDSDDNFFVYEVTTGKNLLKMYVNGFVRDIIASSERNQALMAVAGSGNDAIRSLSLRSGKVRMGLSYEPIPDNGRYPCTDRIAVHLNSRFLASAHNCGCLRLWDLKTESIIRTWQSNSSNLWVRCLKFSSDGTFLITSFEKIWGRVPSPSLSWAVTSDLISDKRGT